MSAGSLGAIKTENVRLLRHHKAETLDLYKPRLPRESNTPTAVIRAKSNSHILIRRVCSIRKRTWNLIKEKICPVFMLLPHQKMMIFHDKHSSEEDFSMSFGRSNATPTPTPIFLTRTTSVTTLLATFTRREDRKRT